MINLDKTYRHIYILESRSYFPHYAQGFDPHKDLVLTFDFGLNREIKNLGGEAYYVDSLCTPEEMQNTNFLAAEFLKKWHYDNDDKDIFTAHGVPFGFAFRIEIWNEYLYYVRLRANLSLLKTLKFQVVYLGEAGHFLADILNAMKINFVAKGELAPYSAQKIAYYFNIHKYMADALRGTGIRGNARKLIVWLLSNVSFYLDIFFNSKQSQQAVYAQYYHPTEKIIDALRKDAELRVVTPSLIPSKGLKKYFIQRLIPIGRPHIKYQQHANLLLENLQLNRCATLRLNDGTDISSEVYHIVENKLREVLHEGLLILDSAIKYLDKRPIQLEIMIANLGLLQTIVDCVLKTRQVPSYLIINGILSGKFFDEGKHAQYINSYSENIKNHYFANASNVVCLGDPRMDYYASAQPHAINRITPVITIGTSGFNGINLISHVAVEFDFIYDILAAFQALKNEGHLFSLVIKVRPNGVLEQYKSFVAEYFCDLEVELLRAVPMVDVLQKTDLYISIYSQTLFEASCLGIPVIYYKKDKEYLDPPFDNKSELVTVNTVIDLKQAFLDFKAADSRFEAFLDKAVMEKYIGPLDGKNLERNLDFIYRLLGKPNIGELH